MFDTRDFEVLVRMDLKASKQQHDKKTLQKSLDPFDIRIAQQKERQRFERAEKRREQQLKRKVVRDRGGGIDL